MKIRVRLLMPGLAALTILAILGTGIVLGQLRGGVPRVALFAGLSQFTVAAEADATTTDADAVIVADSGLFESGADQLQQPTEQPVSLGEPTQATATQGSTGSLPEASTIVSSPDASGNSPALGDSPESSLPEPEVADGGADLGAPIDGSDQSTGGSGGGAKSREIQASLSRPGPDLPAQEEPVVLLLAARNTTEIASSSDEDEERD